MHYPWARTVWLLGVVAHVACAAPSVESILEAYVQRFGQSEFTAVEQLTERQSDGYTVTVRNDLKQKQGKERTVFSRGPAAYNGLVTVDDGARHVIYVASERRAYVYPSRSHEDRRRRRDEVRRMGERFDRVLVGVEQVADRPCYHIRMTPKAGAGPTMNVWIDTFHFVALRQEMQLRGRLFRRSAYQKVRYAPNLSDRDFGFEAPDGVKVVTMPTRPDERRPDPLRYTSPQDVKRGTNVRLLLPTYRPNGYRVEGYYVYAPYPGGIFRRRMAAKYAQGSNIIYLNQGVTWPGRPGGDSAGAPQEPTELKPGVLFWSKYDIRLLLIGPRDIGGAELRRVAESVDWYDAKDRDQRACQGQVEPALPDLAWLRW